MISSRNEKENANELKTHVLWEYLMYNIWEHEMQTATSDVIRAGSVSLPFQCVFIFYDIIYLQCSFVHEHSFEDMRCYCDGARFSSSVC